MINQYLKALSKQPIAQFAAGFALMALLAVGGFALVEAAETAKQRELAGLLRKWAKPMPQSEEPSVVDRLAFADPGAGRPTAQVAIIENAQGTGQTLPVKSAAGGAMINSRPETPVRDAIVISRSGGLTETIDRAAPEDRAAPLAAPKLPGMRVELARAPHTRVQVPLPFDLDTRNRTAEKLLIGPIPNGVLFTRGGKTGLHLWKMHTATAGEANMVVGVEAPIDFPLTFMLLDRNGTVTNGLDVNFVSVAPPAEPEVAWVKSRRKSKTYTARQPAPEVERPVQKQPRMVRRQRDTRQASGSTTLVRSETRAAYAVAPQAAPVRPAVGNLTGAAVPGGTGTGSGGLFGWGNAQASTVGPRAAVRQ